MLDSTDSFNLRCAAWDTAGTSTNSSDCGTALLSLLRSSPLWIQQWAVQPWLSLGELLMLISVVDTLSSRIHRGLDCSTGLTLSVRLLEQQLLLPIPGIVKQRSQAFLLQAAPFQSVRLLEQPIHLPAAEV
ncbi:unnamed protein product [Auanema sp. JU1783]|nr:unnamed protein product [Auanema sp. JU1783]